MHCEVYNEVKDITKIAQRIRKKKQKHIVIRYFIICEMVQYYWKVVCTKLKVNIVNPRKKTLKIK